MPALLATDVVLCTVKGRLSNQSVYNTFAWVVSSTGGPTVQQDAAFAALNVYLKDTDHLFEKFAECMPANYTPVENTYQVIAPTRYAMYELAGISGNSGYDAETPNIAAVIERRGDLATRKAVSTLHVPSPTATDWIEEGLFTIAALSSYQAVANLLPLDVVLTVPEVTFSPVIYNMGSIPNVTPITLSSVKDTIRVMRRRTVGRGI